MTALTKISNNLLSARALAVLGPSLYIEYLALFVALLPSILKSHNLRPLDEAMGPRAKRLHFCGHSFIFDCGHCDAALHEESFSFGVARDIYIRDSYFKFHKAATFTRAKTILDLGANRGAFSCLMATHADYIVSVEPQRRYVPIIEHNLKLNGFQNYAVECGFVGRGGALPESPYERLTVESILQRHSLDHIDFIKMDIEGSEFALFDAPSWLERVDTLTVEIHSKYGNPASILEALSKRNFDFIAADENLVRVDSPRDAGFVYAWRRA